MVESRSTQSSNKSQDSSLNNSFEVDKKGCDANLTVLQRCDSQLGKDEQFLERLYNSVQDPRLEGEALKKLYVDVNNLLEYITRISYPVNFKLSKTADEKLSNVVYGECGSGKSTL